MKFILIFTNMYVSKIKVMALRNGRWFKLDIFERALINLVIKLFQKLEARFS